MKALTSADLEGQESYKPEYPISQQEFQFGYAYTSNEAWVDFRPTERKRSGIYGDICVVSDSNGNWMDTFWLPGSGFDCVYPSICEKIN